MYLTDSFKKYILIYLCTYNVDCVFWKENVMPLSLERDLITIYKEVVLRSTNTNYLCAERLKVCSIIFLNCRYTSTVCLLDPLLHCAYVEHELQEQILKVKGNVLKLQTTLSNLKTTAAC